MRSSESKLEVICRFAFDVKLDFLGRFKQRIEEFGFQDVGVSCLLPLKFHKQKTQEIAVT